MDTNRKVSERQTHEQKLTAFTRITYRHRIHITDSNTSRLFNASMFWGLFLSRRRDQLWLPSCALFSRMQIPCWGCIQTVLWHHVGHCYVGPGRQYLNWNRLEQHFLEGWFCLSSGERVPSPKRKKEKKIVCPF